MDSNDKNLDNSLESAMNMTQDEIEKLLAQQQVVDSVVQDDIDDPDLASLLAELEGQNDSDAQGISELLNKADNNEIVDDEVLALLKSQEEPGPNAYDAQDLFGSDEQTTKEGFFKKLAKKREERKRDRKNRKDKKVKSTDKEEIPDNLEEIEITDMLVEQQDDSMADALALLQGEEVVETTTEKVDKKAKKKDKKDKKDKKTKKAKKSNAKEEILEDDEAFIKEKPADKKKSKGKKDKKEKKKSSKKIPEKPKEKPTIEDAIMELEEEQAEPPHKNKVIMVFAASILIMLGFLVVNFYFTRHANKKLAEEAYEAEDYLECYQLLYGQKLNDSQAAMFHRSELILKMDIFWSHYNEFVKEHKWLEGLDELVQFVHTYPEVSEYATEWNCQDTVKVTYNQVEKVLTEIYFTDIQEVSAIAELESDVEYTKALVAIVEQKEKKDALNQKYPDILPEEEERVSQKKD